MLLEEFEKKTNIFVPGEYFDLIHLVLCQEKVQIKYNQFSLFM